MKRFPAIRLAALLSLALALSATAAQAEGWSSTAFAGFDRDPLDRELRGGGRQLQLEDRFSFGFATERSFSQAAGRETVLGFGLSREHYPDATEGDRLRFDASAEYRVDLAGDRRQLAFRLEGAHARDAGGEVYSRLRFGTTYRMGAAPRQMLTARARVGFRDQNEANSFEGYDQSEWLGELAYSWQSPDWAWYLRGALYHERRDAERDIYSYEETGLRLMARYRLDSDTRLTLRLGGYARDYVDGGREDRRVSASVGLEHALTDRLTIEGYGGYMRNRSTHAEKAFEGPQIGLMLRMSF